MIKRVPKSNLQKAAAAMSRAILGYSCLALAGTSASAASSDWLSIDLNTRANVLFDQGQSAATSRDVALEFFKDDLNQAVSFTQSIRGIMDPNIHESSAKLVDSLMLPDAVDAETWIAIAPAYKPLLVRDRKYFHCRMDVAESRVFCDDPMQASIGTATSDSAPTQRDYDRALIDQMVRIKFERLVTPSESIPMNQDLVTLIERGEGLLSVSGGKIHFSKENESKKLVLGPDVKAAEWSVFVRDPAAIVWDEENKALTSKKAGDTEMFVVTPGRISIIAVQVDGVAGNPKAKSIASPSATAINISPELASLDGLDKAAAKGDLSASFANDGRQASQRPVDLIVGEESTIIGEDGLTPVAQIVRAKAKVKFESIKLKVVDERSLVSGYNFPVSGIRVKVAGTDFAELTDARGEIEIRDIPTGARILVEISDARGYLMPQVAEIVADREGLSRAVVQTIRARRFSSMDLIARSGGVVQDMRKSSFCGTVHQGSQPSTDVKVALDAHAIGPFYFNGLGLVDLRRSGTGPNGQFCFFNVDPGPVGLSIHRVGERAPLAGVVSLVGGRHSEEAFDINDARHVSTTLTAVASANEQLGAEVERANRHELVEQSEIFAVGAGHMMMPIDDGIMTTATRVLPVKGRVWTVSAASDFETMVQPVAARSSVAKQISTLIPNGFISDMAVLANTVHNSESGSVVIEHGQLTGHGSDPVKFRLVDSSGRDVGDGWYFADQPVAKAVFFNVPPGVYGLIVESGSGHWIASETTVVYSEAVSFVKTGSHLERVSSAVRRSLAN